MGVIRTTVSQRADQISARQVLAEKLQPQTYRRQAEGHRGPTQECVSSSVPPL